MVATRSSVTPPEWRLHDDADQAALAGLADDDVLEVTVQARSRWARRGTVVPWPGMPTSRAPPCCCGDPVVGRAVVVCTDRFYRRACAATARRDARIPQVERRTFLVLGATAVGLTGCTRRLGRARSHQRAGDRRRRGIPIPSFATRSRQSEVALVGAPTARRSGPLRSSPPISSRSSPTTRRTSRGSPQGSRRPPPPPAPASVNPSGSSTQRGGVIRHVRGGHARRTRRRGVGGPRTAPRPPATRPRIQQSPATCA